MLTAVPTLLKLRLAIERCAWWDVESCAWDVDRSASAIESLAWAVDSDVWDVDGRGWAVARYGWRVSAAPGLLTALLWLMACAC